MVEMKSSKAESLPSANAKKSISISFNAKRKSAPAKAPNKRPHSALAGEDSDSEEDDIKPQTVVAIDKSGAFSSDRVNAHNAKSPPLTIPTEKNINWEVEARKKYFRDGVIPKQDADARTFDIAKGDPQWEDEDNVKFGLQLRNRRDKDFDFVEDAQKAAEKQPIPSHEEDEHWTERHISHRISDQNVMDAILHERKMDQMIQIHSVDGANYKTHAHYLPFENEQDKFKADVARRPESASLEDYDAIPVEQFGAALLRGMGWNEGDEVGRNTKMNKRYGQIQVNKEIKQRPALLGLGAKEKPTDLADEIGAWGKALKGKKRKADMVYSPVLLQNSKTKEKLTEEEFQNKKERDEQTKRVEKEDWEERRDRNLRIDRERKAERRDRERRANGDGRHRHRDRSRDRSRDRGRHKHESRDSRRR